MNFVSALKRSEGGHWREASMWLLYNLIGSLTPVWVGFLLLKIYSQQPSLSTFTEHGEFALYAAAMFAPALHTITRDLPVPGFAGRQILLLLCVIGMLISTVFYAPVATVLLATNNEFKIDQQFVRSGTLILFSFAVAIAFVVTVLEIGRVMYDPRRIEAEQQHELAEQFDKLGGDQ